MEDIMRKLTPVFMLFLLFSFLTISTGNSIITADKTNSIDNTGDQSETTDTILAQNYNQPQVRPGNINRAPNETYQTPQISNPNTSTIPAIKKDHRNVKPAEETSFPNETYDKKKFPDSEW
jgi:hypothetical protein